MWQPLETIPTDGTQVLVWVAEEGPVLARYAQRGTWGRWVDSDRFEVHPIRWMPIPPDPTTSSACPTCNQPMPEEVD